jgi:hypothetical protein
LRPDSSRGARQVNDATDGRGSEYDVGPVRREKDPNAAQRGHSLWVVNLKLFTVDELNDERPKLPALRKSTQSDR